MSRKILILFAHPSQHRSEVNVPLVQSAHALDNVNVVDLYAEYPRLTIDVAREQQRLLDHDVIIFQHPLYWYSTPAILKQWQDLVLEYGFAYGAEGTALHGKLFFCAISAGGPEVAYCDDGYNHFTVRQLLYPLEQTANLCGMHYLPPFVLYSSRLAVEENRLNQHIEQWRTLLQALRDNQIDIDKAQTLPKLNNYLAEILPADESLALEF